MIWTDCYKELVEIIRGKNEFLASIPDEYSELREQMENTPEIEHIDMWHEQVSFLDEEHPFPSPAVFIEFNYLVEPAGYVIVNSVSAFSGAPQPVVAITLIFTVIGLTIAPSCALIYHRNRIIGS